MAKLKFINMKTREYTVITEEVSQREIWSLITNVNSWKSWDNEVVDSRIEGDFKAGNTFMLHPKGAGEIKVFIEEVVPDSYYRDVTRFPFARLYDEQGMLSSLWFMLVMKNMAKQLPNDIKKQITVIKAARIK